MTRSKARHLCGDGILSGDALFECDGDVAPHLDGENDRGGQKQRSDGDVDYGRDDHGKFGLRGVSSPHDARDEGEKAKAELRDHQAKHGNCGTADSLYLRVDGDGANRSPGEDDGHDCQR